MPFLYAYPAVLELAPPPVVVEVPAVEVVYPVAYPALIVYPKKSCPK